LNNQATSLKVSIELKKIVDRVLFKDKKCDKDSVIVFAAIPVNYATIYICILQETVLATLRESFERDRVMIFVIYSRAIDSADYKPYHDSRQ